MKRATVAGAAYFAIVFAFAFATGIGRTLGLEAGLGLSRLQAVAVEAPAIIAVSFLVCEALLQRLDIGSGWPERVAMSVTAFALLFAAEVLTGLTFGKSLAVQFRDLRAAAGLLGLAAQLVFAAMPLLLRRRRVG